ncbi:MAG: glycosyl hydrolase [Promethearchaeota archaeon]
MDSKQGSLAEIFKNPPNEFRMMPFWFWNHEMVEKEVVRQVQDHHEHGIGGEFIHPRHGRLTPYMGRRWLENVEAAADKCKELGMPCFLYDEDNWPSGPAGGYITGPYRPENRGKYVGMFDEDVFEGPGEIEYALDYGQISDESTFFAAIAVPNPAEYPDFSGVWSEWKDVSDCVEGDTFKWTVPEGEWCVMFFCVVVNSYRANLNGYIDILREETVRDFIDFTHKRYVDYFVERGKKDYLGDVIPGIFTDEPSMSHMSVPGGEFMKSFAFTPAMPAKFREMHGYGFNEVLLSLVYDTGAISAKHRCDYWATTIELYTKSFYKQIYDYCEQNGLVTTGHINAEGAFPSHIKNHGDFFKVFEYMHYGGCDQLTEVVRPDGIEELWDVKANPYTGMAMDMITASKFASSVAHLLGKPRVLVEAWGTSSWDIRMGSAKRVNDYLIATGCDLFVPHSFNISEDSYRKGDHPAAFNYQPYYKHWKELSDYNGRLCAILNASRGTLVTEVLYLYPAKSFHAEIPCTPGLHSIHLGEFFYHGADNLYRQQVEFELANEEMICGGSMEGGVIKIRDESFKVLYLGATTCVTLEFARFVKDFFDAGGKVLANYSLPYKDATAGESREIAGIFREIFGMDPAEHAARLLGNQITGFTVRENENGNGRGGMAIFLETPFKSPWTGAFYPLFEAAMRKLLPVAQRDTCLWKDAGCTKHPAYVMAVHKSIDGKEFYFVANTSDTIDYRNVKVVLDVNASRVESWDALTGEISGVNSHVVEGGKTTLVLDFPVYKSYLFAITPAGPIDPAGSVEAKEATPITSLVNLPAQESIDLGQEWQCSTDSPNGAMLYMKWQSEYRVEAGDAWGYRSVRTFKHEFTVKGVDEIKPVKLVIEGLVGDYGWCKTTTDVLVGGDRAHFTFPRTVKIAVNGVTVPIKFDFNVEYLDAYWIVADISKYLVEGENYVEMVCSTGGPGTFHVVTDPWRLIGNFEANEGDGVPVLEPARSTVTLGDIGGQGFPRYFGGFAYTKSFDLPGSARGKKVILSLPGTRDCIEVWVNGTLVDVLWHEWDLDITSHVKPGGRNELKLVYFGIAQNMLQTNVKPAGIEGNVILKLCE